MLEASDGHSKMISKAMATKDDIKDMATKADIKTWLPKMISQGYGYPKTTFKLMATKADLTQTEHRLGQTLKPSNRQRAAHHLATREMDWGLEPTGWVDSRGRFVMPPVGQPKVAVIGC